uniref:F-box protein At5g07610-like n=1 Tax=Erigeron canadensis TaxID=72917 RepID=UPI001CB98297|nr:F-box protein At5g07610-like [Erigeron canadensis]
MVNTRAKFKKSGSLIGSNDDILTEILRRLPAKAILRFKSVSKHWLSLLSHSHFTSLYSKRVISPGLFVRDFYVPFDAEKQKFPPFRSLDFYPDLCGIKIVQSCNGLFLCCSAKGNERSRKYYVFNPTTKQFAVIPSVPGGQDVRKTICFTGLGYHQRKCVHFKVVCIRNVMPNGELFQIQVYSSNLGKWKIINESFNAPYYTPYRYAVYWNGAIHWAPSYLNPSYFNLDKEKLQTLPLPEEVTQYKDYRDGSMPLYFGESRGHLHLVENAPGDKSLHLNVYEMLSDHSGWFVKYQVDFHELPTTYPEMIQNQENPSSPHYYKFEVFDVVRGEKEQDSFMVVRIAGKIIRYNITDKSFKQIYNLDNIFCGKIGSFMVHRYTESLTSF